MKKRQLHISPGVRDYLPEECRKKRKLENLIADYFDEADYEPVQTPALEYIEVFSQGVGEIAPEKMLKVFDPQGRILVLRPDMTTPIARVVATRYRESRGPFRFYYVSDAFGNHFGRSDDLCQYTQAGIELIGEAGSKADAEVIALAISTLEKAGLKQFQVDIGQVDFFRGLMMESGLDDEAFEQARDYVDDKNLLALEMMLAETGLEEELAQKIMILPTLYGGAEVLEKAAQMTDYPVCREALENLKQIYQALVDRGLEQYISIDLGMVHAMDYYSGLIFRGITQYFGKPLLSGGRYDALLKDFGRDMPATGFAMGIDRILDALIRQAEQG